MVKLAEVDQVFFGKFLWNAVTKVLVSHIVFVKRVSERRYESVWLYFVLKTKCTERFAFLFV